METNNKIIEKKSKKELQVDAQKIQRAIDEFCEKHPQLIAGTHLTFASDTKRCNFSFLVDDEVLERDYTL